MNNIKVYPNTEALKANMSEKEKKCLYKKAVIKNNIKKLYRESIVLKIKQEELIRRKYYFAKCYDNEYTIVGRDNWLKSDIREKLFREYLKYKDDVFQTIQRLFTIKIQIKSLNKDLHTLV